MRVELLHFIVSPLGANRNPSHSRLALLAHLSLDLPDRS